MKSSIPELYSIYINSTGVCTDSRNIIPGSVFWALKGENFDGNTFVEQALKSGVEFAVSDSIENSEIPNCIYVENSLKSLQEIALFHRRKLNLPIIGITGTNGKTTTKELVRQVLSLKYKVGATKGNLNNHIGVPLTLLSFDKSTEIGIIEMGASRPGEIAELCAICEPDFGIITNIGKAHIEGFGTFENVIKTKLGLYDSIRLKKGIVFYNSDNQILSENIRGINSIPYGNSEPSKLKIDVLNEGIFFSANIIFESLKFPVKTSMVGTYNSDNVLAAICIGLYYKMDIQQIINAIQDYKPTNNRSQLLSTAHNKLILDAYNANPTSMKISLDNFSELKLENKIAILGDMLELGSVSDIEHENIIIYLEKLNIEKIFLVGKNMTKISKNMSLPNNFNIFEKTQDLADFLSGVRLTGKNILLKGSRGIGLEKLVEFL